jgi:hypothetical protein
MVAGGSEADSGVGSTGTEVMGAALAVAPGIGPLREGVAGFSIVAVEVIEFCGATAGATGSVELFPATAEEFVSVE